MSEETTVFNLKVRKVLEPQYAHWTMLKHIKSVIHDKGLGHTVMDRISNPKNNLPNIDGIECHFDSFTEFAAAILYHAIKKQHNAAGSTVMSFWCGHRSYSRYADIAEIELKLYLTYIGGSEIMDWNMYQWSLSCLYDCQYVNVNTDNEEIFYLWNFTGF